MNRKISHGEKIAQKLLKLNDCLTKGTCCLPWQSNEKKSHNSIIGNEKKSNCDNGLALIQISIEMLKSPQTLRGGGGTPLYGLISAI